MFNNPKELRESVQKKIVDILTQGLKDGSISEDRSKEIAKYVLDMLPEGIDMPKLLEVIPKLDDNFYEITSAVLPIMKEYESRMRSIVNDKITKLISEGKFDDALNLTKKAIQAEKSLS